MKTILAAAAALTLLSAGAMAQTYSPPPGVSCETPTPFNPGKADTNTARPPAGASCETLMGPGGTAMLQNGPGTTDFGSNTHEGPQ